MSFVPYICDTNEWKKHFTEMSKNSGRKNFYTVTNTRKQTPSSSEIKLVSPVSQNVEQAKQDLKRKNEDDSADSKRNTASINNKRARKTSHSTSKRRRRNIKKK